LRPIAAGLGIWVWEPARDALSWENDLPRQIFGLSSSDPPMTTARSRRSSWSKAIATSSPAPPRRHCAPERRSSSKGGFVGPPMQRCAGPS
jgi:hypothetical protein